MNQKTFNKMWHKSMWYWTGVYTLIGGILGAIAMLGLLLYGKHSDKKDNDDLFE